MRSRTASSRPTSAYRRQRAGSAAAFAGQFEQVLPLIRGAEGIPAVVRGHDEVFRDVGNAIGGQAEGLGQVFVQRVFKAGDVLERESTSALVSSSRLLRWLA